MKYLGFILISFVLPLHLMGQSCNFEGSHQALDFMYSNKTVYINEAYPTSENIDKFKSSEYFDNVLKTLQITGLFKYNFVTEQSKRLEISNDLLGQLLNKDLWIVSEDLKASYPYDKWNTLLFSNVKILDKSNKKNKKITPVHVESILSNGNYLMVTTGTDGNYQTMLFENENCLFEVRYAFKGK